jgi:RNA polymerase sigma-70 factor (ECF subfamily)
MDDASRLGWLRGRDLRVFLIGGPFMDQMRGRNPIQVGVTRSSPPNPPPGGPTTRAELYKHYADKLGRMARRRGLRAHDAEDAIQRAFTAILGSMGRYDPERGPFDSWVLLIARRTIRDHASSLRNRPEQQEAVDAADPIDLSPDSEQRMIDAQAHAAFLALLDVLPAELREVFVMADVEELTMPSIARELGISEQAGYARLRRARALMRARWEKRRSVAAPLLALSALTLDQLSAIDRNGPPLDPELKARVWDRLERCLDPEHSFVAAALKAVPSVLLFCAGMGAGALLYWALSRSPSAAPSTAVREDLASVSAPEPAAPALLATAASQSSLDTLRSPPATTAGRSTSAPASSEPLAGAAPRSSASSTHLLAEASAIDESMMAERAVIQEIRFAIRDHDPAKALAAVQRHKATFKSPRLADVRDDLWRQAMTMNDAQLRE